MPSPGPSPELLPEPLPRRKLPLLPLAGLALVGLAAAWLGLRALHLDVFALKDRLMYSVRAGGPWVFFASEAVIPALGVPLIAFNLVAGEAFTAALGLGGVMAAAMTALALNLALSYWLARYALRPLLVRLADRYGYRIPRLTAENGLSVTLLIRLTPGPPYAFQCYLLGLAAVPFRVYFVVSWLCLIPWSVGAIVLGRGILNGNFTLAAAGLAVLAGAVLLVQRWRRKYAPAPGQ
jgi:uncharacterized membrane protein YdjX (TVP38/TMEM64 family)